MPYPFDEKLDHEIQINSLYIIIKEDSCQIYWQKITYETYIYKY